MNVQQEFENYEAAMEGHETARDLFKAGWKAREKKAQPVQPAGAQEPRYWVHNFGNEDGGEEFFDHPTGSDCPDCVPLYLEPPAAAINEQLLEALRTEVYRQLKEVLAMPQDDLKKALKAIAAAEAEKAKGDV